MTLNCVDLTQSSVIRIHRSFTAMLDWSVFSHRHKFLLLS